MILGDGLKDALNSKYSPATCFSLMSLVQSCSSSNGYQESIRSILKAYGKFKESTLKKHLNSFKFPTTLSLFALEKPLLNLKS